MAFIDFDSSDLLEALAAFSDEVEDDAKEALRDAISTAADVLTSRTPVDLDHLWGHPGQARGGWYLSINGSQRTSPGLDEFGDPTSLAIRLAAESVDLGDEVSIENDVPYIDRLNDGWSKQDKHFIEAAEVAAASFLL